MKEQNINIAENEIDLIELIKKLWRNRKLISIVTVIFMVIGVLYALFATPIYKSTLTMYPAAGGEKMGGLASMAASFGIASGGNAETYNIEDVVKSRTIAREVVLHKWKTNKYDEPVSLIEFSGEKIKDTLEAIDEALENYRKVVSISTNKETGLMKLNVETEDPVLSAEIGNYLGRAVTKYVQEYQGTKTIKNIEHINKRLKTVNNELTEIEENLKIFRIKNRDMSSPQVQLEYGRLQRELQIKQQVYLTLNQQIELAQIERIKKSPVINILDKAEVAIKKSKPVRSLICIAFTFLGGIIGCGLVLLLPFINESFGEIKLAKYIK